MSSGAGDRSEAAWDALARFAELRAAGDDDLSFLEFCRVHPEPLASELRALWTELRGDAPPAPGRAAAADPSATVSEIIGDSDPSDSAAAGDPQVGIETRDGDVAAIAEAQDPARSKRYRFCGDVGQGGMGKVVKVWDTAIRRVLAMKVEHAPSRAGDSTGARRRRNRFLEEAQVTGQLDHPGVVPVHELGVGRDGRLFFTMRLVKGDDVARIFELARAGEEGWSETRALGVLVRICQTVAYAHANGVIHRDLKPANVMVGVFGEVYVMDWGLAKLRGASRLSVDGADADPQAWEGAPAADRAEGVDPLPAVTQEGTVVGTVVYMPPEQALGRLEEVDERSDVYAIGAMLYELLAGHMPYLPRGSGRGYEEVLLAVQSGPPDPLEEVSPPPPAELVAICEKAMARERAQRYATVAALGEDIQAYLENRVVRAHRTGPWIEFKKWRIRNRGMWRATAAAALFLFSGLLSIILLQWHTSDVMERRNYVANIQAASWQIERSDVRVARDLLDACAERHRRWEWYHLERKLDSSRRVFTPGQGSVYAVAASADGRLLAAGGENGSVVLLDPGRAERAEPIGRLEGHRSPVLALAFAADGGRLVSGDESGAVRLWGVEEAAALAELGADTGADSGGRVLAVAVAAAGAEVWAAFGRGQVRCWRPDLEPPAGTRALDLEPGGGEVTAVAFDLERGRLASIVHSRGSGGEEEHRLAVRSLESGGEQAFPSGHSERVFALAFSDDGTRLASASWDNTLRWWALDAGEWRLGGALRGHESRVLSVAFLAERLVSSSGDNTIRVWDLDEGESLRVLRGHEEEVFSVVAAGSGGAALLSGSRDGTVRLWDATRTGDALVRRHPEGRVLAVAFSPDGQYLAAGGGDPESPDAGGYAVGMWETAGAELSMRLAGHAGGVSAVAFDAAGERLAAGARDGTVRIWRWADGVVEHTLEGHRDVVAGVEFAATGERLWSASWDGTLRAWSLTGQPLGQPVETGERMLSLDVASDGRLVATGGRDGWVRLWSAATGESVHSWPAHEYGVQTVAFDAAGTRLASGSRDKLVHLWSLPAGELERSFGGHKEGVLAVAFSPDGSRIVSGSWDNTVRIWHAIEGDLLTILRGHSGRVAAVAFSPDGSRIASGGWDRTVCFWNGSPRPVSADGTPSR